MKPDAQNPGAPGTNEAQSGWHQSGHQCPWAAGEVGSVTENPKHGADLYHSFGHKTDQVTRDMTSQAAGRGIGSFPTMIAPQATSPWLFGTISSLKTNHYCQLYEIQKYQENNPGYIYDGISRKI